MTTPPVEFWSQLGAEFANSPEYRGRDPDDDPGYFVEWLVGQLYEARCGGRKPPPVVVRTEP